MEIISSNLSKITSDEIKEIQETELKKRKNSKENEKGKGC